ncbi:DUF3992 domain-containing protein [Bacillus solimangrovi]|nr:S-Ena type endospore appendage [Bacillus solimangrovi]
MDTKIIRHKQCIRVDKVYDWITQQIKIEKNEILKVKTVQDEVCANFCIHNKGKTSVLWQAEEKIHPSGTLTVCIDKGSIDVIVNGIQIFTLSEGESRSITLSNIKVLEVRCVEDCELCAGRFVLSLNYQISQFNNIKEVSCILTDEYGNPVNPYDDGAIICEEISDPNNRENINITLPDGDIVTLQIVELLIRGFIVIEIVDDNGKKQCPCPIPFNSIEQVVLCAPIGTKVDCEITDFTCRAILVPTKAKEDTICHEVIISISICENIQSIAKVKIELDGAICKQREEIKTKLCRINQIPDSCSTVFK